jgi:hypothetical protein
MLTLICLWILYWTTGQHCKQLATEMLEHSKIVNCIVNDQDHDWSDLNFDLFDEVYLYYALRFQHNITLDADNIDCLPTNTHDLLLLR